jgi:hypothetical protein
MNRFISLYWRTFIKSSRLQSTRFSLRDTLFSSRMIIWLIINQIFNGICTHFKIIACRVPYISVRHLSFLMFCTKFSSLYALVDDWHIFLDIFRFFFCLSCIYLLVSHPSCFVCYNDNCSRNNKKEEAYNVLLFFQFAIHFRKASSKARKYRTKFFTRPTDWVVEINIVDRR